MARVPYQGTQETAPELAAPNDYQRIEASPNSFGAQVGQGLEALSAGALDASKFYGEVAADEGFNNVQTQKQSIFYGDLSKPMVGEDGQPVLGPDGTPVGTGGVYGKRGQDALDAIPQAKEAFESYVRQQRDALPTPQARLNFDVVSRRYLNAEEEKLAEFKDSQYRNWGIQTNEKTASLTQNAIGTHLYDPDALAQDKETLRTAFVRNYGLKYGGGPQIAEAGKLAADQEWAQTQIKASIVTDPKNAQRVLDENKGILASLPNYDAITHQVQSAVFDGTLYPEVSKAVGQAVADAQQYVVRPGVTPDVSHAIGQQEWHGKGPAPTSIDGAVGPSQIKPSTAQQYGLDPAQLGDPVYAAHAKQVIIDHLSALPNVQGDPARVAVGYFSGAGNIAPAGSPTPYVHDAHDGNGKSVSSYVSDVLNRMGTGPRSAPTTADALTLSRPTVIAQAETRAQELFPQRADYQERYVMGVERGVDRQIAQTRQTQEINAHVVQSAMAGEHPPISEQELLARGPQVAAAWNELQFTNPMARMSIERMFDANGAGASPTYGANAHSYLDRVLAPTGDPNRIADPTGLMNFVGKGADAQITNTGVNGLSSLMALRKGPEGEALAASARSFFTQQYGALTFSNPASGVVDQKGEQLYSRFLAQAIPAVERAAKAGTTAQLFNPKSPDYLGNLAVPFTRAPADIVAERLKAEGHSGIIKQPYTAGETLPELRDAVNQDQLSADEYVWIAKRLGLKAPAAAAPKPTGPAPLRAPPPIVQITPGDDE